MGVDECTKIVRTEIPTLDDDLSQYIQSKFRTKFYSKIRSMLQIFSTFQVFQKLHMKILKVEKMFMKRLEVFYMKQLQTKLKMISSENFFFAQFFHKLFLNFLKAIFDLLFCAVFCLIFLYNFMEKKIHIFSTFFAHFYTIFHKFFHNFYTIFAQLIQNFLSQFFPQTLT